MDVLNLQNPVAETEKFYNTPQTIENDSPETHSVELFWET